MGSAIGETAPQYMTQSYGESRSSRFHLQCETQLSAKTRFNHGQHGFKTLSAVFLSLTAVRRAAEAPLKAGVTVEALG